MRKKIQAAVLHLKPYVRGRSFQDHTVLRLEKEAQYLSVHKNELRIIEKIRRQEMSLEEFGKWHLPGREGLSFHDAIGLLFKLQSKGFLDQEWGKESIKKLEFLNKKRIPKWKNTLNRFLKYFEPLFFATLFYWKNPEPNPEIVKNIKSSLSWGVVAASLVAALGLLGSLPLSYDSFYGLFKIFNEAPERGILLFAISLSVAFTLTGTAQAYLLWASGCVYVPLSFELVLGVFFRLGARSSEVVFLPTSKAIRFFLIRLAVPWLLSGVCFLLAGRVEEPLFSYIGLGFLIQAVLDFSPFHRSLLICFCEWLTATLDFQDRVLKYLYDRMFVSLFEKRLNTVQRFIDDFLISTTAAMGIAWLYGVGLILIDLVVFTLPSLWNHIPYAPISFRSVSASLLILGMAFAMTYVTGLLFFITGSNLFSVLDVPLRKARRAWLLSYTYSSKEAIETFLKNHPLFESLQEFEIREVALLFRKKRYEMGQVVIRQGEEGDEFFILLEGETQVFRENSNGTSDLLSILYSGDSFGETALIEKCNRTATVRASKHCVLLSLSTKNFQKLFSVNSGKAKDFTNLIRNIKLIQDSQALSHLTATEIRKLLQKSNEVVFEKGQAVVERGEEADEVFIIKEGEAAVFIDGQTVAKVGKGDLVGVIAVIKDIQRTADVVAQSKLRCLKIPKEHFLSVCLSNLLVALLVADLSDAQIAEQKAA